MKNVVDVITMRNSDMEKIKEVGSTNLMYEAGKKLFESYNYEGKVGIVCGSGNNAGDGYVLASFLPDATILRTSKKISDDALFFFKKLKNEVIMIDESYDFNCYDIIVDCIFGTGFNKEIDEVDGLMLLKLNDYKLYELLKKRYLMKKFSVKTNEKVIYISDWHELINYYLVNYLFDKTITDSRFVQELTVPNDYLLEAYRNGSLKWNSRAILHLISIGSVLYYNASDGNKMDVLQTKLLKDYCLNHIDE